MLIIKSKVKIRDKHEVPKVCIPLSQIISNPDEVLFTLCIRKLFLILQKARRFDGVYNRNVRGIDH